MDPLHQSDDLEPGAIAKVTGNPEKADDPKEKSFWEGWKIFLDNTWGAVVSTGQYAVRLANLFSASSSEKRYAEADDIRAGAEIKRAEAQALMMAAQEDAERKKEQRRLDRTQGGIEQIRAIFDSDLPPNAKAIQMAILVKEYPEIMEQIEYVQSLKTELEAVHGARIAIQAQEDGLAPKPAKELPQEVSGTVESTDG